MTDGSRWQFILYRPLQTEAQSKVPNGSSTVVCWRKYLNWWKTRGTRDSCLNRSSVIYNHHQMSLGWSGSMGRKGRACGTHSGVGKYLQGLTKKTARHCSLGIQNVNKRIILKCWEELWWGCGIDSFQDRSDGFCGQVILCSIESGNRWLVAEMLT